MRGLVGYLVATEARRTRGRTSTSTRGWSAGRRSCHGLRRRRADRPATSTELADYLDAPRRAYQVEVRARAHEQNAETGARQVATLDDGGDSWRDQHVWHCS